MGKWRAKLPRFSFRWKNAYRYRFRYRGVCVCVLLGEMRFTLLVVDP